MTYKQALELYKKNVFKDSTPLYSLKDIKSVTDTILSHYGLDRNECDKAILNHCEVGLELGLNYINELLKHIEQKGGLKQC